MGNAGPGIRSDIGVNAEGAPASCRAIAFRIVDFPEPLAIPVPVSLLVSRDLPASAELVETVR